ncbi:cell division protein FtsZ [Catalinimonas alkaloidigena]|uniref:Cell division protein FtsZ n=2 Tax=Catalinimonas alkaloidigena TaxID=1075417 RepID=A0A1G9J9B3_9BACT|nr:cell division protein FtsZ [Catalinimonas alkaloidigena]
MPERDRSIIKVIGVGGGGSNAINHMFNQGIKDVDFVVVNTDAQALKNSPVPNRLQIGAGLTEGLGAGANPERGRDAALESQEQIREFLDDGTKMVFITAGMGGGTGTGAAPVIARIAKDLEILTVGIVTAPFLFEGRKKRQQADLGIAELRANCDTVLVILNDKLREIFGNLSISQAFAQADNVLTTAAKGIAEIITVPGYVNVDFEDVKTVMRDSGAAVMGSATTSGDSRASRAAEQALASPLLNEKDIHGAKKILLSIVSGSKSELQMDELSEITGYIQEKAGEDAEMIFGHGIDDALGEHIRVTVIATGFDKPDEEPVVVEQRKVTDLLTNRSVVKPVTSPPPAETKRIFSAPLSEKPKSEPRPMSERNPAQPKWDAPSADDTPKETSVLEPTSRFSFTEPEPTSPPPPVEPPQREPARTPEMPENHWEKRQRLLQEQARERVRKLKGMGSRSFMESTDLKMYDEPAYLRRNVVLQKLPHSSDTNISRYSLTEDNEILGNNKFLHDNVD